MWKKAVSAVLSMRLSNVSQRGLPDFLVVDFGITIIPLSRLGVAFGQTCS